MLPIRWTRMVLVAPGVLSAHTGDHDDEVSDDRAAGR